MNLLKLFSEVVVFFGIGMGLFLFVLELPWLALLCWACSLIGAVVYHALLGPGEW